MAFHNNNLDVIRSLGLVAAASLVVGNMVGQGVFLKTRVMICNVDTPSVVIAVWVVAGLLTLAGALSLAELGAMMPKSGGIYVFLREAYGEPFAFLYSWMIFVIGGAGVTILGVAFAIFLNVVTGGAFAMEILSFGPPGFRFVFTGTQLVAVIVIGGVMLLNCAAVSFGGRVITALTAFKIALVIAVGLGAFVLADGNWTNYGMSASGGTCEGVAQAARGGFAGFAAAMLGALLAYNGWVSVVMMAGEVEAPKINIPLALTAGVLLVIALYLLVNVAYFYVLTPVEIASISTSSSVATETASRYLGIGASKVMAAALLVSVLGTLQIANMWMSRSIFALSRDGLLFDSLGKVSANTRVPVKAVVVQALSAMILVFFGSYDTLTDYYMFALWIFYGLAIGSLFVLRRKLPAVERPYRTFGYPVVPILFLVVTVWVLANALVTSPFRSVVGLALIALGLPFYYFRKKRSRGEFG